MIIGLTGGIASGKSTVSNFFKELGVEIVDADIVAREISERKVTIDEICNIFGRDILDENGKIVRGKLRERVFQDRELVQKLNSIIHPQVIEYFKERRERNRRDELLIFDIPLLYEAKMDALCDKVIVVGVDRKKQIERVIQRDGSSEEVARNIIANQMSLDDKIKRADIVIMNDGTLEELKGKVLKVYKELREVIK
ncbi:dephospho-CoA kinase [uncultured Fusobacterium sp.]|uniref:Dephospho-CoA kinase n=1 Tax=Candidatus Fusobacterium pullicola TaxID=2838601 RepID=A0A9E2KYN5_9FUSO|nr:dephospho-CoA kinase [uncultured Fusobacterium sp.]MBU3842912.1 dephospho-CoA kinase [Candidatus Fusobacterium pullicola]